MQEKLEQKHYYSVDTLHGLMSRKTQSFFKIENKFFTSLDLLAVHIFLQSPGRRQNENQRYKSCFVIIELRKNTAKGITGCRYTEMVSYCPINFILRFKRV